MKNDPQRLLDAFSRAGRDQVLLVVVLSFLLFAAFAGSLIIGPVSIPVSVVFNALFFGDDDAAAIVREVRLPRAALSTFVGAALGLCGAAAQSLTRNPLADPAIFGAPQAAALGAVCLLYFGYAEANSPALLAASIGGAALSFTLVFLLVRNRFSVISVLLAGLALGSLFSAGVSIALSLSPNPFAMAEIVFWLMGSFADRSLLHVLISAPALLIGCVILLSCGGAFRALSLGEDTASSMGFNPGLATAYTAIGLALAIGAATAVSGSIAFVGLMAPHLVRTYCNGDPKALLIPSMLSGALLMTSADVLVRLIPSTNEIPVGVITAILGAPFFLYLVTSRRAMFGSLQ